MNLISLRSSTLLWKVAIIFTSLFPCMIFLSSSRMLNPHSLGIKGHHDICIGGEAGEDASIPELNPPQPTTISSSVHPALEQESNCYSRDGKEEATVADILQHATSSHLELPGCLWWIPDNWTLSKWMTATRCTVSEWASLLLLIINPSMKAMGQVC